MTEKTRVAESLCHFPNCERLVDPESGPLGVCRGHGAVMAAAAEYEAWSYAHSILKPWVESARAIGHDELTGVIERALVETETEAELAQEELKRAEVVL